MALQKTLTTDLGYDAEYHRVQCVSIDFVAGTVSAEVFTYKDAAAVGAGARHTGARLYTLNIGAAALDNLRTAIYNKLKQQTDFENATDV